MSKPRIQVALCVCLLVAVAAQLTCAQRDNDDFDDEGFDDTGYANQPSRDAEESNQNPSNYSPTSEEDLDDDDDVDETNLRLAQVAPDAAINQHGPQTFESPIRSVMPALRAQNELLRRRRSATSEGDVEDAAPKTLVRNKRYSKKYIGPVYTYVKTDKHAHYKWGVKHKVGKHYG